MPTIEAGRHNDRWAGGSPCLQAQSVASATVAMPLWMPIHDVRFGGVRGSDSGRRTEPMDKRVRAYGDDVLVVDTLGPLLFWEERFPVPSCAFHRRDVRADVLRETSAAPPREPFFFLPKGPMSQWFDVVVGERTIPHAASVRDARRCAGPVGPQLAAKDPGPLAGGGGRGRRTRAHAER